MRRDEYVPDKEFDFSKTNVSPDFDLSGFQGQIAGEYSRGYHSVTSIRSQLEEEDPQFQDQSANRDKINDYSFFALHSAFMARTYLDKAKITWKNIGIGTGSLVAKNLNSAFQTDMDTPEMARIYYQIEYDKYKS